MNTLTTAINERIALEVEANSLNDNKRDTLNSYLKAATDVISSAFDKYNVDMTFAASRRRKTAMLNVYAINRVIDLAAFMSGNVALNHFTLAVMQSLVSFDKANIKIMSHAEARVACSALHDEDKKISKEALKLIKKTSRVISSGTVNTQCTITTDALRIMNVIEVTSTSNGEKAYRFRDTEAYKTMIEQMIKHNML